MGTDKQALSTQVTSLVAYEHAEIRSRVSGLIFGALAGDGQALKIMEQLLAEPTFSRERPAGWPLQDSFGNFFFQVGDLVTRDGTDIHRVVDHNGSDGYAPDGMTVICVKAPSSGWTKVGETEFNTCRRYDPVGEVIDHVAPSGVLGQAVTGI